MTYDEARIKLADRLEECAKNPCHLEPGYDEIDVSLPRGGGPEWGKLFVALSFWDGWIDASNHEWMYYSPIAESDWPTLAQEIAAALRLNREIENPVIVEKFDFRPRGLRK